MVKRREKEKDSRYIQEASAPAAITMYQTCNIIIASLTLSPLAGLHENQTKSSKDFITKIAKQLSKQAAKDEGPIWPTDSHDAENSPEAYIICGNTKETKNSP
jgi:hypothetical protein